MHGCLLAVVLQCRPHMATAVATTSMTSTHSLCRRTPRKTMTSWPPTLPKWRVSSLAPLQRPKPSAKLARWAGPPRGACCRYDAARSTVVAHGCHHLRLLTPCPWPGDVCRASVCERLCVCVCVCVLVRNTAGRRPSCWFGASNEQGYHPTPSVKCTRAGSRA